MFASFFLAGFECATGYNATGEWIDQVAATHHDKHVDEDYSRLREVGIQAAREAIRWPLVDRGGQYDFSNVEPFIDAANRHGIEVIWDLFHYGYPSDLDPFTSEFTQRFAAYCHAAAKWVCARTNGQVWFTPVNEPSYFSWAAGDVGRFAPHATGRGFELKVALARAGIAGIEAIWDACPSARIVNVDPLCNVVMPGDGSVKPEDVEFFNQVAVFESLDMLSGKLMPELGGSRRHLDVIGLNYYWTNQWELGRDCQPLAEDDPRRVPLHDLLARVHRRYGGDIVITETSHVDDMRPVWMKQLTRECEAALRAGLPLRGVCLYPILGMPEWHSQEQWTRMGLWDVAQDESERLRTINRPMHKELRRAMRRLAPHHAAFAVCYGDDVLDAT
jgi:beta-glucosidase/6-phospho-beta-glucosidase/beta-galactosidase